jgi:hypothetical protein
MSTATHHPTFDSAEEEIAELSAFLEGREEWEEFWGELTNAARLRMLARLWDLRTAS